jgi:N-formylglutamate amidohydrolase
VPGSRGRSSAAEIVIDTLDRAARDAGLSVSHDDPYRGGFSTGHYGNPGSGVHAVQIEIARSRYMDERSLTKKPNEFEQMRGFCRSLTASLAAVDPRQSRA